jgi:hypothetical protein
LKNKIYPTALIVLLLSSIASIAAPAQSLYTARQPLSLSVFGGATGTFTGLQDGKNLGITAGADLRILNYRGFYPSIELRGTYPIHSGLIDAQKNILAGGKLEHRLFSDRVHPYVNLLYGRGQINYENGGYISPDGTLIYIQTDSGVLSPGAGVDLDATHYFSLKLDAQFQRYGTPVTTSGSLYAKALTVAVVYHFDFNRHFRTRDSTYNAPQPNQH